MRIVDGQAQYPLSQKRMTIKETIPGVAGIVDMFTPQPLGGVAAGAGVAFTDILDIRVPTTTPLITDEKRDRILNLIQPGDIILETNNAYPGWQRFEKLTLNSNYTHAAMYEGDGKFIEATTGDPSGAGVIRTDLREYLEGRIMVEIIRPPYKTPEDREAALNYCKNQLGKPYDSGFSLRDDDKIYCAELVKGALDACPNKINTPLKSFFGRHAVAPDSFQDLEGAQVVYSDGSNFWKNMASHWPVIAGATTAATVGGKVFGAIGAVTGFFGGLLLSIAIGNKIQTGHFNLTGSGK